MTKKQDQNQFNVVHLLKRGESTTLCGLPRDGSLSGGSKNLDNVTCGVCRRNFADGEPAEVEVKSETSNDAGSQTVETDVEDQAKVQADDPVEDQTKDQAMREQLNLTFSDLRAAMDVFSSSVDSLQVLWAELKMK